MGIFTRTRRGTMAAEADRGLIHPGEADRSPARRTVTGHQPAAAGPPGPAPTAGGRPHIAADLAYHLSVLVVLLAALLALARPRFRAKRAGLGPLPPGASSRGEHDMTTAGSPGPALGQGPGRGRTGPVGSFVVR